MDEIKKQLRKIMRLRQKNLPEDYVRTAGGNISKNFLSSGVYKNSGKIFVYVSTGREPDTLAIINDALKNNKKVYVPKCVGNDMLAVKINGMENLIPGKLGILEPEFCQEKISPEELDLIIVPCLSASSDGRRLGHGMGCYDKFLSVGNIRGKTVCFCFRKMLCDEIPMAGHDVYMQKILCEDFCS